MKRVDGLDMVGGYEYGSLVVRRRDWDWVSDRDWE